MNPSTASFYLGTYSTKLDHVDGKAKGIGHWMIQVNSGEMTPISPESPIVNSSHLCVLANERTLYAVSEVTTYEGQTDGYLTILRIDEEQAQLSPLGVVSSEGPGPAYVSLDHSERFLFLANYAAGNVVVYPIGTDGMLGAPSAMQQHHGSSIHPDRQEAPHPHAIISSPDNAFVYVPDLGLDIIKAYAFDDQTGSLTPAPTLDTPLPPGSGPRHLIFHPSGAYAYATLELSNQAAAYGYSNGKLTLLDLYDTLPEDFTDESTCSELRLRPDGKFLYVGNRGHDSISTFAVSSDSGKLERIQTVSTQGATPRNFGIEPGGRLLVVGNQDSHTLVSYFIDQTTGLLEPTGHVAQAYSPALVAF